MTDYSVLRDLSSYDLGAEPIAAMPGFTAQLMPVAHNDTSMIYRPDHSKIDADLKSIDRDVMSPSSKKPVTLEQAAPRFSPQAMRASNSGAIWYNKIDARTANMPGIRRMMNQQMRILKNMPRANEKLSPRARAHLLRKMKLEQLKKQAPHQKPLGELPVVAKLMRKAEALGFSTLKQMINPVPAPSKLKTRNDIGRSFGQRRPASAARNNAYAPFSMSGGRQAPAPNRPMTRKILTALELVCA